MAEKKSQDDICYEEEVVFYHWLMRFIVYPLNEGLWIKVCSFGLRPVLESFLLDAEYQQWLRYRASAQGQLGVRFIEDNVCKNLIKPADE